MIPDVAVSFFSPAALARPKSRTLSNSEPSGRDVTKMSRGFRSRWTIFAACASATPAMACIKYSTAVSCGSRPRSARIDPRSRPVRYSITMNGVPSGNRATSWTRTQWSPASRTAARASRRKRRTESSFAACSGRIQLDGRCVTDGTCHLLLHALRLT